MDLGLENKNIVISGSSRGVGRGIAETLLQEGARVTVTGRSEEDVEKTASALDSRYPGRVLAFAGDLHDAQTCTALRETVIRRWQTVDGAVANAGAVRPVPDEATEADWHWYIESNFDIARRFVEAFIDDLKATGGAVVVIGSIASIEDVGAPLPYSTAKAMLKTWAGRLARRIGPEGVRVNTVEPGNILFAGGNWDRRMQNEPEKVQAMLDEKVPLRRFGRPEEVGSLTAFLLSERAGFITGASYIIDGGQTLGG